MATELVSLGRPVNLNLYDKVFRPLNKGELALFNQQKKRVLVYKTDNKTIRTSRVCLSLCGLLDLSMLEVAYTTSRDGDWTYAAVRQKSSEYLGGALYMGTAKRTTYGERADVPDSEVGWRIAFSRAIETPPILG